MKKPQSPKQDPIFKKYWDIFLPEVMSRDNFKPVHLYQLEILCDLHVEYNKLQSIIDVAGYTYWTEGGRNGPQQKVSPEVTQLNKCRGEIRNYCRMLGIALVKDTGSSATEDEKNEWEQIMPLPKKAPGESEDDFLSRCMDDETMKTEFPDQDQRYAICYARSKQKAEIKKNENKKPIQ